MRTSRILYLMAALTLVLALSPLVAALAGAAIAQGLACSIGPPSATPCLLLGHDVSPALRFMASSFLLLLLAVYLIPLAAALGVMGIVFSRREKRGHHLAGAAKLGVALCAFGLIALPVGTDLAVILMGAAALLYWRASKNSTARNSAASIGTQKPD
jgi:hypothetical protein